MKKREIRGYRFLSIPSVGGRERWGVLERERERIEKVGNEMEKRAKIERLRKNVFSARGHHHLFDVPFFFFHKSNNNQMVEITGRKVADRGTGKSPHHAVSLLSLSEIRRVTLSVSPPLS